MNGDGLRARRCITLLCPFNTICDNYDIFFCFFRLKSAINSPLFLLPASDVFSFKTCDQNSAIHSKNSDLSNKTQGTNMWVVERTSFWCATTSLRSFAIKGLAHRCSSLFSIGLVTNIVVLHLILQQITAIVSLCNCLLFDMFSAIVICLLSLTAVVESLLVFTLHLKAVMNDRSLLKFAWSMITCACASFRSVSNCVSQETIDCRFADSPNLWGVRTGEVLSNTAWETVSAKFVTAYRKAGTATLPRKSDIHKNLPFSFSSIETWSVLFI